jgi:8-oxo-dGTP pyrophosphatase MutT (NUDIX family)
MNNSQPKVCYTAGGMLIHKNKVLLVKHKKLGIWLNPGGHIDEDELPHQAAEREFFEETGVRVEALDCFEYFSDLAGSFGSNSETSKSDFPISFSLQNSGKNSDFLPNPITSNLHWVNKESYDLRLKSKNPNKRFPTKTWKRGCEQHLGFLYLLKPVGSVKFKQNIEETDGIAWFGPEEIDELETKKDIRQEIKLGFLLTENT